MSTADTLYPAAGWHIRGEMGGIWTPPIKLVDGIWVRVADEWLGDPDGAPATMTTVGWGYTRTAFAAVDQVAVGRTDFVPDGTRATLIGLTLTSPQPRTVPVALDAHSELMAAYPWGWTNPNAGTFNLQDTGAYDQGALLFRETGTPPVPNASPHDWAALVAGSRTPRSHELGPNHRGPHDPAVVCPADGPAPPTCDDGAFGKGTGGSCAGRSSSFRTSRLRCGSPWPVRTRASQQPGASSRRRWPTRRPRWRRRSRPASRSPRTPRSTCLVTRCWRTASRGASRTSPTLCRKVHDLQLRPVEEGRVYPDAVGTLDKARWLGAGWPDYPWLFGTDGEYTAFASVAMGQFAEIKSHLRALRDASEVVNGDSGKVVHEVMPDGSIYYGTLDSAGNTDETSKFPSAVALIWRWTGDDDFRDDLYDFTVRNMRYVVEQLDEDGDGWPEGLGNVERSGMGVEKLDNTVYTIRGLRDLADLAQSRGDDATLTWASERAAAMEAAFEDAWWYGGDTDQYADSIDDPANLANDNTKILQRHWIGVTPMDAELVRLGEVTRPLATDTHGQSALEKRQEQCYSGEFGLYHTGTGPTSDPGGNRGPSCDSAVSTVQSERSIFSLNTGIMAVAEGNFGRLGVDEQQRYTTGNARIQLDPGVWEMPGAMPEIAPSPDFTANIDRALYDRSMVLQAWGTYGTLWPVVHQQLGVRPDLGRGNLEVVPQVPDGQQRVAGSNIRLGAGAVDVAAEHGPASLTTTVTRHLSVGLLIGHVLPQGTQVSAVTLNGVPAACEVRSTARGEEVVVDAGTVTGISTLVVTLA